MSFLMQRWQELFWNYCLKLDFFNSLNGFSSFVSIWWIVLAQRRTRLVNLVKIQERNLWGYMVINRSLRWTTPCIRSCCFIIFSLRLWSYRVFVNVFFYWLKVSSQVTKFINSILGVVEPLLANQSRILKDNVVWYFFYIVIWLVSKGWGSYFFFLLPWS